MLAGGGASAGPPGWSVVFAAWTGALSAGAALWALRNAGPRYRLYYGLSRKRRDESSWEVSFYLSSRGRRDITREAFDKEQPIEFDIGAPIRELTSVLSSHPTLRIVEHHYEGTRLFVGPGLISRWQDLRFTIITDSEPVVPSCWQSLIDVQFIYTDLPPRIRWQVVSALGFLAYFIVFVIAGTIVAYSFGVKQWILVGAFFIGSIPIGIWILYRRSRAPLE